MAYGLPGEYALIANGDVTPGDRARVKKMLARLRDSVQAGGSGTQSLKQTGEDGTTYVATIGPGVQKAAINRPPVISAPIEAPLTDLWIPRGFVFVPGNADALQGWGLPVQRRPGDTVWPFGLQNTNPGLDVTRWTVGGPGAQVLLTQDDTTKYPDDSRKQLPIGYDVIEWTPGSTWQPPAASWHIVRPTFNDYQWSGSQQVARQNLWTAVAAKLDKSVMVLPYDGYYDDAQAYIDFSVKYGADSTKWPVDYQTPTARMNKDGVHGTFSVTSAYSEVRRSDLDPTLLANSLTAGSSIVLDVGINTGTSAATARDTADWIRCGNTFWHPDDPALPTLTWDGYPAQNLPFWLVEGGWTGDVGSAVFPLEGWNYQWRGQTRYVYSKNLYAMGRCIGVLPDTVIAAAIRQETVNVEGQPGKTKRVNRVVVITWRASDQFGNGSGIAYLWQFRVWCVDFDANTGVPLHVTDVPVGVYDAATNPKGWRACGAFSVFAAGDSLPANTFWQMLRFNGDGSKAVAAYGIPPYAPDVQFPLNYVCQLSFDAIGPDSLSYSTSLIKLNDSSADRVAAADFDADGNIVWVSEHITSGAPVSYSWSGGGDALDVDFSGAEHVVERLVLDAREGAMATSGHFLVCQNTGSPAVLSYKVRLAYRGVLVAADTWGDTAGVYEPERSSDNWLDRLNTSFARDRAGHYVMGYDLGTTEGASTVYVSWPVCGQTIPGFAGAPVSSYFGSRWLFDGEPIDFVGLPDAPMRAFPIGVC